MDNYSQDRRFKPNQEQGTAPLWNDQGKRDNVTLYGRETPEYKHPESSNIYKTCSICLLSEAPEGGEVKILEDGTCEYCQIHNQLEKNSKPQNLWSDLYKIQRRGKNKRHDCIIGISGGLDSSLLLYLAVKKWGLRPLVIHFDNGFNNAQAEANMKNLVEKLNVNSITYRLDKEEYMNLNLAFLEAGTPDADIPNDIAMTKLMYDTADKNGIKWILNGHDFRTEGSTPASWTYMDARYIQSVYESAMNYPLENYPLFTFWDMIKYGLKGIKQIRPFHYGLDRDALEAEMKDFVGWQDYGGKHCENIYTEYVGAHYLPNFFNINKSIVYLSARVRSGKLTKDEAKLILQAKTLFDMNKFEDPGLRARIKFHETGIKGKAPNYGRERFEKYDFKKWKPVIWVLAKIGAVPKTFLYKYCK